MTIEQQEQSLSQLQKKDARAFKRFVMAFTDDLYLVAASEIGNHERVYDFVSNLLIERFNNGFEDITTPIPVTLMSKLREALAIEKLIPV